MIPLPGGSPSVFFLGRDGDGLWLYRNFAEPDDHWRAGNRLVFRLRK
jgi:hypothetical protein